MNKFFRMLRHRAYFRAFIDPKSEKAIIERFHRLYYDLHLFGKTWKQTYWFGVQTNKCPLDLWVYQEILFALRPDLIIETGTDNGGSAAFLASMCDLLNKGRIITIDLQSRPDRPQHPRIQYLLGSSTDETILKNVREQAAGKETILVILDSDHRKPHVLNELRVFSQLVTLGSYLIVEDSNLNGHPVHPDHGPGPMEAIHEFLKETNDFVIDQDKEKFLMTFNPNGYLKKVK